MFPKIKVVLNKYSLRSYDKTPHLFIQSSMWTSAQTRRTIVTPTRLARTRTIHSLASVTLVSMETECYAMVC